MAEYGYGAVAVASAVLLSLPPQSIIGDDEASRVAALLSHTRR